jgi:hypothetical protein
MAGRKVDHERVGSGQASTSEEETEAVISADVDSKRFAS